MKVQSLVLVLAVAGCSTGPRHIARYTPKQRQYDPGPYQEVADPNDASLYDQGQVGWFEDDRAGRVGDTLVIRIDERETAVRSASTKLGKKGDKSFGVPAAFGLMAALKKKFPDLDPNQLFATTMASNFDGDGEVQRQGRLSATLPVRVRRVLPNGDLYVEGTSVVMVSSEEHHLYVSGIVRRVDIDATNTVSSSRIADAEIEYVGRGDVTDQQRPGWGNRGIGRSWPF